MKKINTTLFFQKLSPLIQNGIPLNEAIQLLAKQTNNKIYYEMLDQIQRHIQAGSSFAACLEAFPQHFSKMDCALIEVGEETGQLARLIQNIIYFHEQYQRTKEQIKKALFYPAIVFVTAIIITVGLLIFIIPQFQEVFASFNTPLPWLTQQVIALADFLKTYGFIFLALTIAATILGRLSVQRYLSMQRLLQAGLLKLPLIGKLIQQNSISLCCTILAIAHQSGIPLLKGIQLAQQATPYLAFKDKLQHCQRLLANGERFSNCWQQLSLANEDAIALLTIGENTGKLCDMLRTLAQQYQDKTQHVIDYLSKLIEPAIMMLLAVITGGLIIAMYLPIFNISAAIK